MYKYIKTKAVRRNNKCRNRTRVAIRLTCNHHRLSIHGDNGTKPRVNNILKWNYFNNPVTITHFN